LAPAAALLGLALAAALGACAARKPAVPEYPFPSASRADFAVTAQGLVPLSPGALAPAGEALPSPLAPRAAALSATPEGGPRGGGLVAAINRFGLAFVLPSVDGSAFKVGNLALAEAAGQSMVGLWPRGLGYLLQLGRDPFTDGLPPRSDFSPELLALDREGKARALPRLGKAGEDLFALFPGPKGLWYAEFREENALGAKLRYATLTSPEAPASAAELRRDLFEAALAPRPLDTAPFALRRAIGGLGIPSLLVRARGAGGGDGYWLSGGDKDEATEAYAWLSADEEAAVVVLASGKAAYARASALKLLDAAPPSAGAVVTGVAALLWDAATGLPVEGLALVSWEEGPFPSVSRAGLSVIPLR
jgi:hypothetical protein